MSDQNQPTRLIGNVLWGSHEQMAGASHRPEDVRQLFCDANASFGFAERIVAVLRADPVAVLSLLPDDVLAAITTLAVARFNCYPLSAKTGLAADDLLVLLDKVRES